MGAEARPLVERAGWSDDSSAPPDAGRTGPPKLESFLAMIAALIALAAAAAAVPAPTTDRLVTATWEDESIAIEDIHDDYATVVISLPKTDGASPSAAIVDSANMLDECKVVGITEKEGRILVALKLGELVVDDGWNGCTAEIRRGHPSDEDGVGLLMVDFGLYIAD